MTKKNILLGGFAILIISLLALRSDQMKDGPLAQFWKSEPKKICPSAAFSREFKSSPYYTGPLIDAHLHMPVSSGIVATVAKRLGSVEFNMSVFNKSLTKDSFICTLEGEGIKKILGLFLITRFATGTELDAIKKFHKNHPGKIIFSFMPAPLEFLRVPPEEIRKILDKNPGLFRSLGELKLFDGSELDNPHYSELYKIARDYKLLIMMHPHYRDRTMVKKILKQYPDVTFLFHGGDKEFSEKGGGPGDGRKEFIEEMMAEFDNVYYSLGTADIFGFKKEHASRMVEKQELWDHLRAEFDSDLDGLVARWRPLIEKYPDRILWETDRQRPQWIYDEDFGHFLEEIARSFIGRLSPAVREKFAYKNAEKLFSTK